MRRRNAVKNKSSTPVKNKSSTPVKNNNLNPYTKNETISSNSSSILDNMKLGAAIGVGSSLGHRAVDKVIGSETNNNSIDVSKQLSCGKLLELYNSCLLNQQNNCDFLKEFVINKCNY
jgi:hypothetical protein